MARKLLQNKIAQSRHALPVTALYGLLVCFASGVFEQHNWVQWAVFALSSFLIIELNNINALIRVYSRMISCSYIMLFLMTGLLTASESVVLVQFCVIVFYFFLFSAYQDKDAVGRVFYAFVALSVASTFFVQILYFLPVAWILTSTNILSLNLRTFCASLFGLLFPYWIVGGYLLYNGDISWLVGHFEDITRFAPLCDYNALTPIQITVFALIVVLTFTGMVHLLRNSFKDKIRTRMFYEIFMIFDFLTIVCLVLQPAYYDFLIGIIVVNTSPIIAHFMALSSSKITNMAFFVIIMAVIALTVCNLWIS